MPMVVMREPIERLAHFKAPKRGVVVDALPKIPGGTLIKRELRQRFEGPFQPAM
jgi:acyl-CoA synthetase (AMP-forming)/AMP-acid ligase II